MTKPLGKSFSQLTKLYIGIVSKELFDIPIDRHFYAIIVLSESQEPMCQKDLAESIHVDNVSMVRIVDYLAKKGFIKRVQKKSDRRAYQLALTEKALKAVPVIKAAFGNANDKCFSGFSKKEREEFMNQLKRIQENLQSEPHIEVKLNFKKIK